ncbi:TatD family hydrolase [Alteromonas sp. ASW11-36]|uniref:TatD family hydrolase n=1 Tax=Alteromonas arenosi TaxID=3055817 RepID=A0ABT7SZE9_9ALTE|nr:TatD family hydrolase [Alteromonas sp. ASW11-36]MDM7861565.1 TatD family hydrolase [Alteromonas sp. ASW11-36]
MRWFDAGVNQFDQRLPIEQTLTAAERAGVTRLCVIATEESEWSSSLAWQNQYPEQICCTLGVHPHNADNVSSDWVSKLTTLASQSNVAAIGECGLDYNRMFSTRDNQLQVFEHQLNVATQLQLPVYLHERDAFPDQYALLNQYVGDLNGGLVHCFTSHTEHLKAYLELGFYIGITGWICDTKRGVELREALAYLPLDRLVLETDAPYLFPKGMKPRQRNNQPANLPFIAERVAELKQVSVEQLSQVSIINTNKLLWRTHD